MTFEVDCAHCPYRDTAEDIEEVFDLQEQHREDIGDHWHVLEFDRTEERE